MSSTKKVAETRTAKTKKESSTRTKREPVKAVSKKTRTTPVKKAPAKKRTKKSASSLSANPRLEQKFSRVEALHGKEKVSAHNVQLAVLSPFRLPVDVNTLMTHSARYGGLFFVFIGAFMAFFYSHTISLQGVYGGQVAQSCASSDLSCQMQQQEEEFADEVEDDGVELNNKVALAEEQFSNEVEDTSDSLHNDTTVTEEEFDSEVTTNSEELDRQVQDNTVTFTLDQDEPLDGSVDVTLAVADARRVDISAYSEPWNRTVTLGSATKRSDTRWVFEWNTADFEDGRYRLKALVSTANGSFEKVAPNYFTIDNSVTTEAAVASEPIETTLPLSVAFSDSGRYMTLKQTFPEIDGSDLIRVYLVNTASGYRSVLDEIPLFPLTYVTGSYNWSKRYDVSSYVNGTYDVIVAYYHDRSVKYQSSESISLTGYSNAAEQPSPTASDADLSARVSIANASSLTGFVDVVVESSPASKVELYAMNTASVNKLFLGQARLTSAGVWLFNWDTRQIPNSQYNVYASITSNRGVFESSRKLVTVRNERLSSLSSDQSAELAARTQASNELIDGSVFQRQFWNLATSASTSLTVASFIEEHESELSEAFQKYAAALRSDSETAITAANTRFFSLENIFKNYIGNQDGAEELRKEFSSYLDLARKRIATDVEKVERIIAERKGEGLFIDSDWDGITDFDEMYVYGTDPFSADTSGNGIPDGVAILNGLDPLSTREDASIVFESPEEIGVIREDILRVQQLTTVTEDTAPVEPTSSPQPQPFVLSGQGLPNSFVTLYVFSQPVIVTVRTEQDGSWQYRFERELEDGEHTVYVALTDNSGRIIARSLPFFFTKEAQAYSVLSESVEQNSSAGTTASPYTFLSSAVIYLVLSFAVVAIGLILILLGMYLDRRRRNELDAGLIPETV